jgi:hypothetical protein
MRVERIVD